ncbi:unnamed protein product [Chrysoparadoxa australica]
MGALRLIQILSFALLASRGFADLSVQWAFQGAAGYDERGSSLVVKDGKIRLGGSRGLPGSGAQVAVADEMMSSELSLEGVINIANSFQGGTGPEADIAYAIDADVGSGLVFLAGTTAGDSSITYAGGGGDAYLLAVDETEQVAWQYQSGTADLDVFNAVVVDDLGAFVYAAGAAGNAGIIAKVNAATGALAWEVQQVGAAWHDVQINSDGDLVVAGEETGSPQVLVLNTASGVSTWDWQGLNPVATPGTFLSVAVPTDNFQSLYVAGSSTGAFGAGVNAGSLDMIAGKITTGTGALAWTWQGGTAAADQLTGISVSSTEDAVMGCGSVGGSFEGHAHKGGLDLVCVRLLGVDGTLADSWQEGTAGDDVLTDAELDPDNDDIIYAVGYNEGGAFAGNLGDGEGISLDALAVAILYTAPPDPCDPNPCNTGTCTEDGEGFTCDCTATGFEGGLCQLPLDPCAPNPCGVGVCIADGFEDFTCDCSNTGWEGTLCQSAINPCAGDNPCGLGTCAADGFDKFTCNCAGTGYEGDACEINTNDCTLNICLEGTCTDLVGGYECDCGGLYTGNNCEVDINECELGTDNCSQDAKCTNIRGGFLCSCNFGYEGDGVTCSNINGCSPGVCNTGVCQDDALVGYTCNCPGGYSGDNCENDVNECQIGTHNCSPDANCNNTDGWYTCECKPGFQGDGETCTAIDNCAEGTCVNGSCKDLGTTYECFCSTGWDGTNCDINEDECALGTHNCHPLAACTDTEGSFTCTCGEGYEGSGAECIDTDECASGRSMCLAGRTCINQQGTFECVDNPVVVKATGVTRIVLARAARTRRLTYHARKLVLVAEEIALLKDAIATSLQLDLPPSSVAFTRFNAAENTPGDNSIDFDVLMTVDGDEGPDEVRTRIIGSLGDSERLAKGIEAYIIGNSAYAASDATPVEVEVASVEIVPLTREGLEGAEGLPEALMVAVIVAMVAVGAVLLAFCVKWRRKVMLEREEQEEADMTTKVMMEASGVQDRIKSMKQFVDRQEVARRKFISQQSMAALYHRGAGANDDDASVL